MSTLHHLPTPGVDDPVAAEHRLATAERLGAAVGRLVRTVHRARHRYESVDLTAFPLLTALVENGPMRAQALAEVVLSDPSTVSRQLAHLVEQGYVLREPDPRDRRACQLVVTPVGQAALDDHRRRRAEYLAGLTAGWPPGESERLAALLERLTTDLTDVLHPNDDLTEEHA